MAEYKKAVLERNKQKLKSKKIEEPKGKSEGKTFKQGKENKAQPSTKIQPQSLTSSGTSYLKDSHNTESKQQNLFASLSVPLSKVSEATEPSKVSKQTLEMHIMESGPMRQSELLSQQITKVKTYDLKEFGIEMKGIDPELIPQIEEFTQLMKLRGHQVPLQSKEVRFEEIK